VTVPPVQVTERLVPVGTRRYVPIDGAPRSDPSEVDADAVSNEALTLPVPTPTASRTRAEAFAACVTPPSCTTSVH
jgi:hypothetical protein